MLVIQTLNKLCLTVFYLYILWGGSGPLGAVAPKTKTLAFGFVDVILLHSCHQYISAAYVAIFRVVTAVHCTGSITAQKSGS